MGFNKTWSLFSEKKIINLPSTELSKREVKVKEDSQIIDLISFYIFQLYYDYFDHQRILIGLHSNVFVYMNGMS